MLVRIWFGFFREYNYRVVVIFGRVYFSIYVGDRGIRNMNIEDFKY